MGNGIINILVTGADGQLGRSIRKAAENSADRYFFTDVATLDITDEDAVCRFVADNSIDLTVNCAAFTDVEGAESTPEKAALLNTEAVGILARAMKNAGGQLIHISTDYVFGGNIGNTPRTESEPENPTGVYGQTKLCGEKAILEAGVSHLILRTAWLYSEYGRNFLKTMLYLTASRPEVKVVFDQVGTPTYARDLARAIVAIISSRSFEGRDGIYHYSNEGVCSWFDFATAIARQSGSTCHVLPCRSSEFPSRVVRPPYSVLDKSKFKSTFGLEIPYWTDSLTECLKSMQNEA